MESYKWQIITDPAMIPNVTSDFSVGDLVTLSGDITMDMIIRDINECKTGLISKIRYFTKQGFEKASKRKVVCEYEVFWSPSEKVTYETRNRLIRL